MGHVVESTRPDAVHYYECHVTIEPLDTRHIAALRPEVLQYGFRIADLFMTKRKDETPERSKYDTFMTARNKSFAVIQCNMVNLIKFLEGIQIKVWRYKIEDTIIDSKINDELRLLNGKEI